MTGDDVRDRALVAAHLAGDRDAFPALAARHLDRLYATAARLAGGTDGAEPAGAVREGLLAVLRSGSALRDPAGRPVARLLQQAVAGASLDGLRRRSAAPRTVPQQARPPTPTGPAGLPEALAALPDDQRAALVLVELAGLPAADAAGLLGLSPGAVRRGCARATARLAQLLGALPALPGAGAPARSRAGRGPADTDPGDAPAHLAADDLADLLDSTSGDAQEPVAPGRADHLAHCTACSAALLELAQAGPAVSGALAALPAPVAPPQLAADVDTALRRAAGPGAPAPTTDPAPTGIARRPTVRPRGARRLPRRRRSPTVLLLVALVLAVSAAGVGLLVLLPEVHAPAPPSDPRVVPRRSAPAAAIPTSSTGTDYVGGRDLVASVLPALLRGDAPVQAAPVPSGTPSAGTGGASGAPASGTASPDTALARLRDPVALEGCLSGLRDPSSAADPLALDYARYDGAPALLVVLPSSVPGRADVYVVGSGCRAGAAATLLFTQLPRPAAAAAPTPAGTP